MSNENYTIQKSNLNKVNLYVGISTIGYYTYKFSWRYPKLGEMHFEINKTIRFEANLNQVNFSNKVNTWMIVF